jgi:hypothetical protein
VIIICGNWIKLRFNRSTIFLHYQYALLSISGITSITILFPYFRLKSDKDTNDDDAWVGGESEALH